MLQQDGKEAGGNHEGAEAEPLAQILGRVGAQRLSGPADPSLPGLVGRQLAKQLRLENRYCFRRCALCIASHAPWDSAVAEKFQGQNVKVQADAGSLLPQRWN
jgi:hypothetical protein